MNWQEQKEVLEDMPLRRYALIGALLLMVVVVLVVLVTH